MGALQKFADKQHENAAEALRTAEDSGAGLDTATGCILVAIHTSLRDLADALLEELSDE